MGGKTTARGEGRLDKRTKPSTAPEATRVPSGAKARACTTEACVKTAGVGVAGLWTRTVLTPPAVARTWWEDSEGEKASAWSSKSSKAIAARKLF